MDEETLVATVRGQLVARRQPKTQAERQAVAQEADQVAAEMIQVARAERWTDETPDEPETDNERWWRNFREEVASLDLSRGSIEEVMVMEGEGRAVGEWMLVRTPSPPGAP
ncbi:MAG: hypothetical protein ACRDZR_05630 [Acidimicrobiales bacterium]